MQIYIKGVTSKEFDQEFEKSIYAKLKPVREYLKKYDPDDSFKSAIPKIY